jgi:hypothetical protein
MKRVEIRLSLEAVLPLIAVIREAADSLSDDLAAPNSLRDIEPDLREGWREDLVSAQNEAITVLLALFDETFDESGIVGFDADNAEPVLRACAAVRLRLRERFLKALNEEVLESGDLEIESLQEPARKAFMCYLFLATIQELIIQHLDTSILDG